MAMHFHAFILLFIICATALVFVFLPPTCMPVDDQAKKRHWHVCAYVYSLGLLLTYVWQSSLAALFFSIFILHTRTPFYLSTIFFLLMKRVTGVSVDKQPAKLTLLNLQW